MTTKLVWPVTLLASFALAAACGGGSSDADGTGGEGGEDGSGGNDTISSGGSTGGQNLGGEGGSLGGGGPVIIVPLTCSDGEQNESETDVDCGGPDCDPCDDDAVCVEPTDCDSGVCTDGACIAPTCGDKVTNGTEDCDPGRETDDCNVDCTFTVCGDGYVNERVEECEPDPDLGIWQRCGRTCIHGADLDGTWRDEIPGQESAWETLDLYYYYYGTLPASYRWMPSFHYAEETSIVTLYQSGRYDIRANTWASLAEVNRPAAGSPYNNGASDGDALWIVIDSTMYKFDLESDTWAVHTESLPTTEGAWVNGSSVVHDGDGFLWYVGRDLALAEGAGENVLVRFDPTEGTYETFSWLAAFPAYVAYEPRVAYDPISESIVWGSYLFHSTFLIFDIESEAFTESAPLPDGGPISDATCQDRAGGVYVVSEVGRTYRYDIAANEYHELPLLPAPHDGVSSCFVSELGYLYYGTTSGPAFARLHLNRR